MKTKKIKKTFYIPVKQRIEGKSILKDILENLPNYVEEDNFIGFEIKTPKLKESSYQYHAQEVSEFTLTIKLKQEWIEEEREVEIEVEEEEDE